MKEGDRTAGRTKDSNLNAVLVGKGSDSGGLFQKATF